jgi:F-type H+-transporting ATPase subunit epsilon
VGSLQASEVRVTELDGTIRSFAVRSGFVSVTPDGVTVLSDEATPSSELDLAQARADLVDAEAAVAADATSAYAREDLVWAELRIRLVGGE